jgi:hypothetical protein
MVISNYIGVCTVEVGKNSFHCKRQLKNVLGKGSRKKGGKREIGRGWKNTLKTGSLPIKKGDLSGMM